MIEIGVDIENIERFKKYNLEHDSDFLKTIFSEKELEYCYSNKQPAKHLTARFCAKEAFYKAVSEFSIKLKFNEIEVLNKENGKPYLKLPEAFKKFKTNVSLSHDKTKAIATVIVKNEDINEL